MVSVSYKINTRMPNDIKSDIIDRVDPITVYWLAWDYNFLNPPISFSDIKIIIDDEINDAIR